MAAAACALAALVGVCAPPATPQLPELRVDRDNIEVTESCRLVFAGPVADADGNGVVHIRKPGVVVDLAGGALLGAADSAPLHGLTGTGIRIEAPGVTLRNGAVRGFKVGVHATGCHGTTFEDLDLGGNWAQRLASSPLAEDGADWLWPHANDQAEWRTRYGAALCIERADGVTVRRVRALRGQNGLILDRVGRSQVYDCDFSFLSGWGIALWRSCDNTICRNALDFCVRGYSHGVYNRGQDSAGILCFEQCSRNFVALNSVTHGGDGWFGFAGKEALGEAPAPEPLADDAARTAWYRGRGCNGNVLIGNDFSFAVAHSIEHTFSFDNAFVGNVCEGAAICGVWGGYSQRTLIAGNRFAGCGEGAYGLERGGVNIEHGQGNVVAGNSFEGNRAGVHLWWDDDAAIAATPWGKANGVASDDNRVVGNRLVRDEIAIDLRTTQRTLIAGNTYESCAQHLRADESSRASLVSGSDAGAGSGAGADAGASAGADAGERIAAATLAERDRDLAAWRERLKALPGSATPIGARRNLGGREAILIGPEGPYDYSRPRADFDRAVAESMRDLPEGAEASGPWQVVAFATTADPRTHLTAFRATAAAVAGGGAGAGNGGGANGAGGNANDAGNQGGALLGAIGEADSLHLPFGGRGPSQLAAAGRPLLGDAIGKAGIPTDHFGLVARRTIRLAPGCWKLRVLSDDGVRVLMDGQPLLEDWTWHAPREAEAVFALDAEAEVAFEVEYFELDGHAALRVRLDRCGGESDNR